MHKQLIANKTGMILIAGALVMTTVVAHPRSRYQQHGEVQPSATAKVYQIQEAALQFEVPSGWKVEKGKHGQFTVSKSEAATTIGVSMAPLGKDTANFKPEALFKLFAEGALKDVKKDLGDSFKSSEPTQATQNGISQMFQTFTAKDKGVEMQGVVFVLFTDNPVGVFAYGTKAVSATMANEAGQMLGSFKKIE